MFYSHSNLRCRVVCLMSPAASSCALPRGLERTLLDRLGYSRNLHSQHRPAIEPSDGTTLREMIFRTILHGFRVYFSIAVPSSSLLCFLKDSHIDILP